MELVLDTNILFSGLYSSLGASYFILKILAKGEVIPILSNTLVFEYEDVLKRNHEQLNLTIEEIDEFIDELCNIGKSHKIYYLWRPILPDPKDDHLLELAVASDCKKIITHNIKNFKGAEKFGISVIKPGELLEDRK